MDQSKSNGVERGIHNDLKGLKLINDFKFLRAKEVGKFLWPRNGHSDKYGERICRKWLEKKYVLARKLPNRAGNAFVLAKAGVEFLSEYGVEAYSGKDWGSTKDGEWYPPKEWQHHCLTNSLLSDIFSWDGVEEVIPENKIRKNFSSSKIPDGIFIRHGFANWLEVENHRKSGKRMDDLVKIFLDTCSGKEIIIDGISIEKFTLAYPENKRDENGHLIDHKTRFINALKKHAKTDEYLYTIPFDIESDYSVSDAFPTMEIIESDAVALEIKRLIYLRMEKIPGGQRFHLDDESVWEIKEDRFSCELNTGAGEKMTFGSLIKAHRFIAVESLNLKNK